MLKSPNCSGNSGAMHKSKFHIWKIHRISSCPKRIYNCINCSSLSHIPKRSNTQPRSSDVSTPAMKVTRSCVVPPQRGEKKVKQCHMCRTPPQSTSCHHLHSFVQVQLYQNQLFDHSVMHSIHYFIHVIRIWWNLLLYRLSLQNS